MGDIFGGMAEGCGWKLIELGLGKGRRLGSGWVKCLWVIVLDFALNVLITKDVFCNGEHGSDAIFTGYFDEGCNLIDVNFLGWRVAEVVLSGVLGFLDVEKWNGSTRRNIVNESCFS